MIRLNGVSLVYEGQTVLEDLSLRIPGGSHIALMGPSGCGKTSLLQLIAGLLPPTAGQISVNTDRIAYVFQEPRLLPGRTALQNVNAVLGDRKATLPRALEHLSLVGLAEAADKLPGELSGGMRQRVNIARALAYEGELLLLDEPFKGIDEAQKERIMDLILEHARDRTLLMATHDRDEAERLCRQVMNYENKTFR